MPPKKKSSAHSGEFDKAELNRELERFRGDLPAKRVDTRPEDLESMSETLARFAAPIIPRDATAQIYSNAIRIAAYAWNVAFTEDEAERREDVRQITKKMEPKDQARLITARQIMNSMIKRKLAFFADYRECVVRYEVKPVSGGWALLVATAPPPLPGAEGAGQAGGQIAAEGQVEGEAKSSDTTPEKSE